VLALASDHETFGNVLVEALAHGLAVVSTDCGGPSEVLNSPETGVLVPCGDETALAAAMRAALLEPGDPKPRVRRAQDFSVANAVELYERLFERLSTTLPAPNP
jgi:glycosyltransferase involved in cell wall biosynthesis